MRCHPPRLHPVLILPLLAPFAGGCASLIDPHPPVLRIRTDSVVATVRDSSGRELGTTPFAMRIPARERQRLVLAAPGFDSAVVTVGRRPKEVLVTLLNPLSWLVDGATGAFWRHDPRTLSISLSPSAAVLPHSPPDPSSAAPEAVPDEVAAVVLQAFADAAEMAGCEPLLVHAWRDAALVLANGDAGRPVAESVRRIAREEVQRAAPEIRRLCTQPSPRVERLREIRAALADADPAAGDAAAPPLAPVFFGPNDWRIRDDSVRARLHALGAHVRDLPVTLVVEGFGDAGELRHQELGYQRAMSVIRELQRGGMPADCCVAIGHAGTSGDGDARRNRRATVTLDYGRPP